MRGRASSATGQMHGCGPSLRHGECSDRVHSEVSAGTPGRQACCAAKEALAAALAANAHVALAAAAAAAVPNCWA